MEERCSYDAHEAVFAVVVVCKVFIWSCAAGLCHCAGIRDDAPIPDYRYEKQGSRMGR